MRVYNALVEACRNAVLRNNPIDILPLVRQLSGHPLFLISRCAKALKRATGTAVLDIDDASQVSDIDDDDEKRESKTAPQASMLAPSSHVPSDTQHSNRIGANDSVRASHDSLPTIPHNFGSLRTLALGCESLLKERPSPLHQEIAMTDRIPYVSQKVMQEVHNCDRHACNELRTVETYVVGNRYSCILPSESSADSHVKVPCNLVSHVDGICEVDAEVRVGDEVVLNRFKVPGLEELLPLESILYSGKMCVVLQIVASAEASGEKVLIFSQSLHVLSAIESMLLESAESFCNPRHVDVLLQGIPHNMRWRCGQIFGINGGTPFKDRVKNVQLFGQARPGAVMLLGKLAAKEGITLTAASRVILMDVSFNPSNDLQASSRAHRFGQERPVYVYRLIQDGTLERAVYDRQVVKQQTFLRVVDDKNPLEYGLKKDLVASMNKLCRNPAKLPGVNSLRPPCNFPENLTDDKFVVFSIV
jgi:SNF2 family DNA or RNA helicase